MVNAQKWLDKNYPNEARRKEIKILVLSKMQLRGNLDLSDFVNLRTICAEHNYLTGLEISKNYKLEQIEIYSNEISANLNIFSHLANLKYLYLGTSLCDGLTYGNNFSGSLKSLENCQQLEQLGIRNNKNITEGLEYLPTEKLTYFDSRGTIFPGILKPYGYDLKGLRKWQEAEKKNWNFWNWKEKKEIQERKFVALKNNFRSQLRGLSTILFPSSSDSDISNVPFNIVKTQAEKNQAKIQALTNELEIEREHAKNMDNWYRNSMTAELNDKITNLELAKQKELEKNKEQEVKINQLENEIIKLKLQLEQNRGLEAKIVIRPQNK